MFPTNWTQRSRRKGRTTFRRRKGVATVELAFVAPFVFFLIFASVEFARMMMMQQALTNAAREGCRKATLPTTQTEAQIADHTRSVLKGTMKDHDDPDRVVVVVGPSFETAPTSGTTITVKVSVKCRDITWFPTTIFSNITISGQATMKRE